MKIVRRSYERESTLWSFLRKHLPASLVQVVDCDGYGVEFEIRLANEGKKGFWGDTRPIIATVDRLTVSLKAPQYYSDFEDLLTRYEKQTGKEPVLEYWES